MDVSAVATVAVREMEGIPSCFQVLVSRDVGVDDLVVGIDDLKTLHILHKDFPKPYLSTREPTWVTTCAFT